MSVESVTRRTLRSLISATVNDRIGEGTASAGGATTLDDAAGPLAVFTNAADLQGANIFIHTGTSLGDERTISLYAPASDRVTVIAWTATPTTSSQYELHRKYTITDYNDAIDAAIRFFRRRMVADRRDWGLVSNAPNPDPLLSDWSSTSALNNSWTIEETLAREDNVKIRGHFSAKWTIPDATAATFLMPDPTTWNLPLFEGITYTLKAVVYSVDGRATALTFGQSSTDFTLTETDTHAGAGWELITTKFTVNAGLQGAVASQIGLSQPTGSGAIDNFVDSMWVEGNERRFDYELLSNFHSVYKVEYETGSPSSSNPDQNLGLRTLPHYLWEVNQGNIANPGTLFRIKDGHRISTGSSIIISGHKYPDVMTADTDTADVNVEAVTLYAAYRLLLSKGDSQAPVMKALADQALADMRVGYKRNERIVEPN